MFLWRISNHRSLDGRGGLLASARWHTKGQPVVYLAESAPGALLEALVHLELSFAHLPAAYQLLKIEAPLDSPIATLDVAALAATWASDPAITRAAGDAWLAAGATSLLRIPSAIVPDTFNLLLNPAHPKASQLQILWHRAHPWDKRLVK